MKNKLFIFAIAQLLTVTISASTPTLLRINASGNSMQNETVLYFDANGSFVYNPSTDAPSLGVDPGQLNILSRFDSIDYQIKCLPLLNQNISVPLKVVTGLIGVYQIYASDMQNVPAGACISLHDNLTNTDQDLRLGNYSCSIADTESVARFVLNISVSVISVSGSFLDPTCKSSANGYISVNSPSDSTLWNYYWKDSLNNIIYTSLQKSGADTLFGMNAGAYRVDVTSSGTCISGSLNFFLQGTQLPQALFTSSADTATLFSEVFFTNSSINSSDYWWDFGDGMGSADTNSSNSYASTGTYTVTLTAIGSLCADTSVFTKEITIIEQQTTGIKKAESESNNMFISRDQEGYFVKFGYSSSQDATISITDLLGQQVISPMEVKAITNEKVYVAVPYTENKMFIISSVSTAGHKVFKKYINQ